jgi:hypothetical protein
VNVGKAEGECEYEFKGCVFHRVYLWWISLFFVRMQREGRMSPVLL